jgi:hypothetical protein
MFWLAGVAGVWALAAGAGEMWAFAPADCRNPVFTAKFALALMSLLALSWRTAAMADSSTPSAAQDQYRLPPSAALYARRTPSSRDPPSSRRRCALGGF